MPRTRVRIFCNECTWSTPLDPKQTFWCVSYYLGAFGTTLLPYETRCKTGRTSAQVRATKSHRTFRNERTRSTPLDPKLTFWCISYYLGAFGTFWLPYESRGKTGRRKSGQNGPNYCKSSCREVASELFAMNAPNPPHWTINWCFGAFRSVWVHLRMFHYSTNSVQNELN